MIHYHGGPITPETCALHAWRGRHAFVSWAHPEQLELAASITQSFALDNGAFSAWRSGRAVDWGDYYRWVAEWRTHPAFDFAVIPDVIGGSERDNDNLIADWPHGTDGVPVWHLNESIDRLKVLADQWPRVALGSAAEFDVRRPQTTLGRLADALPAITGADGRPVTRLHGLRMLNPVITANVPLASADSTNIARNVSLDAKWRGPMAPATAETRGVVLAERIESVLTPDRLAEWITPTNPTLWDAP